MGQVTGQRFLILTHSTVELPARSVEDGAGKPQLALKGKPQGPSALLLTALGWMSSPLAVKCTEQAAPTQLTFGRQEHSPVSGSHLPNTSGLLKGL